MADVTSSKAAEILGVAHSTVRAWCRKGLIPSARLEETPLGSVWMIPEKDLKGFKSPKIGRPSTKKASKKKR
jgi:excisionase family DNA binding protein